MSKLHRAAVPLPCCTPRACLTCAGTNRKLEIRAVTHAELLRLEGHKPKGRPRKRGPASAPAPAPIRSAVERAIRREGVEAVELAARVDHKALRRLRTGEPVRPATTVRVAYVVGFGDLVTLWGLEALRAVAHG
jgi:hypothetical protein